MRSSWSQLACEGHSFYNLGHKNSQRCRENHHIVKAKFDERRIAANISLSLSMPVSTRWFSYYKSMSSLHLSKYVLITLVDEESTLLKEIQPKNTSDAMALIKSNRFWDRLCKLSKALNFLPK